MASTNRPSTSYSTGTSYPSYEFGTSTSRPPPSRRSLGTAGGRPKTGATTVVGDQDIICSITEARGIAPTIGLAFVNLSTSEAVLCQICDSQTYARTVHKLAVFDPTEILFSSTSANPKTKLFSIIEENLPHLRRTLIDRKYWAENTGHEYVQQLAFQDDVESIKVSLGGNYFAACCFAAVGVGVFIAISS